MDAEHPDEGHPDEGHPEGGTGGYGEYPAGQYGQPAPYDPYRYGPPAPQQPAYPASRATGKQIVTSSWRLLKEDPSLIALPFVGMVSSLFAAAILFVPGWLLGAAIDAHDRRVPLFVGAVLATFAASCVGIFFQAGLVIGANERADGGTPTFGGVLRQAWALRGPILAWALVATTVGMVIRAVERRIGGVLGAVLGFLGGLAWAILTFLVLPVIIAERLGPIDAVRRSGELIRRTWGTGLRTTLRFGVISLVVMLPAVACLVIGFALFATSVVLGATLVAIAVVAMVVVGTGLGAVTTYARALIYRYAVGRPVPGVPAGMLAGAFAPRRRRRG